MDRRDEPGLCRVCCLWSCSVRRDDELSVLDGDSHALSGFEACLYEPLSGDAEQRKKRAVLPLPLPFGRGMPAHELLDGGVPLG